MKKHFFLLIMALSLSVFVGCDYDEEFTPPNYVTFDKTAYGLNVNENSSSTMEVTVYTGNITGADRTFNVIVDPSSTLTAAAYTLPATVTVPANSNQVTFTVGVSDTNLNNAGDKLVLRLGEEAGLTAGPASTINISRICAFDVAGNYMITVGASTTPRPVVIEAGAAANQYVAKDLYAVGYDVTFTVNPVTNVITLATQPGFVHATYGPANVTGLAGSKVEPCLGKLTLVIRVNVAAGAFAARTDVLTKSAE